MRGRHRGRTGWIAGTLTDRAARGITKAIVHLSDDVELLATSSLAAATQLSLALTAPQHGINKNAAGRCRRRDAR